MFVILLLGYTHKVSESATARKSGHLDLAGPIDLFGLTPSLYVLYVIKLGEPMTC